MFQVNILIIAQSFAPTMQSWSLLQVLHQTTTVSVCIETPSVQISGYHLNSVVGKRHVNISPKEHFACCHLSVITLNFGCYQLNYVSIGFLKELKVVQIQQLQQPFSSKVLFIISFFPQANLNQIFNAIINVLILICFILYCQSSEIVKYILIMSN